jgi:hypothetical protein
MCLRIARRAWRRLTLVKSGRWCTRCLRTARTTKTSFGRRCEAFLHGQFQTGACRQVIFLLPRGELMVSKLYCTRPALQAKVKQKIEKMRQESAALTPHQLEQREAALARQAQQMEAMRDLRRTCMHVDMDAFFASVEELDDPKLKAVPMAGLCPSPLAAGTPTTATSSSASATCARLGGPRPLTLHLLLSSPASKGRRLCPVSFCFDYVHAATPSHCVHSTSITRVTTSSGRPTECGASISQPDIVFGCSWGHWNDLNGKL